MTLQTVTLSQLEESAEVYLLEGLGGLVGLWRVL